MATAQEILSYIDNFSLEAQNGYDSKIHLNDSILHACVVMKALITKASQEFEKNINMYCGTFSLFRDKTYDKVQRAKDACDLTGLSPKDTERWNNLDLFGDLQNKLREFLANRGKLNLIVQREIDSLRDNQIWTALQKWINEGTVKIYAMTENSSLDHFAVTYEAYRIENSDEEKTALCCFKDEKRGLVLNNSFTSLKNRSQLIYG